MKYIEHRIRELQKQIEVNAKDIFQNECVYKKYKFLHGDMPCSKNINLTCYECCYKEMESEDN